MYEFGLKVIAFFSENMSIMDFLNSLGALENDGMFPSNLPSGEKKQVHESLSDPILVNCNQKTFSKKWKKSLK